MTASMWLRNLAAFGMQAGILILAGAVLARVFRIQTPRAALAYWRTQLLACVLLPFCQPWQTMAVAPIERGALSTPGNGLSALAVVPQTASVSWWPSIEALILLVVVAGIAARALWLAIGALALGRIRREASPLDPLPDTIKRAQERVGARAGMFVSHRVAGPVTFGVLHPVIVFPPAVAAMEESIQHAIACHELLHVRRRDWLFEVLEEGVRTVLWFHPAVWWLIGRIQLSREQVVDQTVIRLTESKDRYVEALLAVAIAKSPGILTPASAFLRRSALKKRVAQILQESTMTTRRLILSLGASGAALALAATMAVRSFPLEAQGQPQTSGGGPVQILKGGDHLLHGGLPEYPHRAIEARVEGDVLLDLAVDDRGEVSDARVLSGPDELRKAALEAVLGWHYAPTAVSSISTQATLRFHLPPANVEFRGQASTVEMKGEPEKVELTRAQRTERLIMEIDKALADPKLPGDMREDLKRRMAEATEDMAKIQAERMAKASETVEIRSEREAGLKEGREVILRSVREGDKIHVVRARGREKLAPYAGPMRLAAIRTERVSDDAVAEVLKRAEVKVGDTVTEESLKRLQAAATAVDEHFRVGIRDDAKGGITVTIVSR
jgi:bla regulator protein blaR1